MIWKGRHLKTIEDLMRYGIDACNNREEAEEFMLEYVMENTHARANIGYLAGYYSQQEQDRIFDWFDVVHPIYGTKGYSTETLFKIGKAHGSRTSQSKTEDIDPMEYIRANIRLKP